ncbi:hypothetical protein [Flavobacterium sp. WC2430]|uniref:hypothetical protein n=1 Tax=Flavobacterium sp. WC2430 TaxID=3234137 RepID=UPI003467D12C
MKSIIGVVAFLILMGCQSNKANDYQFYQAVKGKDTALLKLTQYDNKFYGQLEIRYGGVGKESGEVRGEKKGDTLKGKFDYRTYGGSKKWAPFVLLKRGKTLKMGSGVATTFMNIPLYIDGTLKFEDSDFQFKLIDSALAKKLGLVKE